MSDPTVTQLQTVAPGAFSLTPRSLDEAMSYAKLIASSNLCPKQFMGRPGDVLIAVQLGAEHGVSPIESLMNIAVINGRPCMWGDLIVALVQRSGQLEYLTESWDEATKTATVKIKRRGKPEAVQTFSMADAARAGLAGKDTYKQYPQRMCVWRPKSWLIRAEFADVIKGLGIREEIEDYPKDVTEASTVLMPQRASAGAATETVDAFLRPEQAPRRTDAEPADPSAWEGAVESIAETHGNTKGRDWTMYTVTGADKTEFSTFSSTIRDAVSGFVGTGELVRIRFTVTTRGGKKIAEIEPAAAEAEGE